MTTFDDLDDVPNHIVPEPLADHLLAGGTPPADVHDTVAATAAVLRAAAGPATEAEQAAAAEAAAAFARTVALTATTVTTAAATTVLPVTSLADRRRRRLGGIPGRIAAGVVVATLCSAGAAAAATGHLPDPLQRTVAGAASHVGLSLPDPRHDGHGADDELADGTSTSTAASTTSSSVAPTTSDETTTVATTTGTTAATTSSPSTATSVATTTDDDGTSPSSAGDEGTEGTEGSAASTPVGPNVEGPAKKGLCTAYAAHEKNGSDPNGVAFASLRMAAEAKGMTVLEFCADVLPPTTTGSSTPGASSSVPKPKGPPATIKGPDEPVDSTIASATMPTNNPVVTITVKPGNGKGNGNPNGNPNG